MAITIIYRQTAQAYEQTAATLVGCLASAQRKFIEVQKAQAKGKTGKANWAISHIRQLYQIESVVNDMAKVEKQRLPQRYLSVLRIQTLSGNQPWLTSLPCE